MLLKILNGHFVHRLIHTLFEFKSKLNRLVCFCFILSSACSPPREDPAVIAYQTLISYLSLGDQQAVWKLLSAESKAKINQRLQRDPSLQEVPKQLELELDWAFESPFAGQASVSQKQKQSSNVDQKLIHTTYASQSWLIPVVQEEGIWRVDLLGAQFLSSNHQ